MNTYLLLLGNERKITDSALVFLITYYSSNRMPSRLMFTGAIFANSHATK